MIPRRLSAQEMISQEVSGVVTLEFYTRSHVLSGQVSCPSRSRLSDLLNESSLERSVKGEFIEFVNAYYPGNGDGDTHQDKPKEYIRKAAIQLVAVPDADLGRGIGTGNNPKAYPFVRKYTARVSLQLETYTLIGSIHCCQGQSVQDVLNDNTLFLPLTDVTIAREYHVYATRPFVAVNKQQIISSREERFG